MNTPSAWSCCRPFGSVANREDCLAVWKHLSVALKTDNWSHLVANREDCLAVWKHSWKESAERSVPSGVANREDCLAVWKHACLHLDKLGTHLVADCEDCLAVWKHLVYFFQGYIFI